jgi:hypothetical protein
MPNSGNLLLASLSDSDTAALRPHLKSVHLESEKMLFEARGEFADIYFPAGAVVSLVVGLSSGETIEAAMVGKGRGCRRVRRPWRQHSRQSRHCPARRTCDNMQSE